MRWWWFLVIFFLAVIQTTFLRYFEINGVIPNILIVLAILFVVFLNFDKAWLYLIFIGLILDFFSDFRMGANLTALMVTAVIFHLFIKDFLNQKSVFPCIFLGLLGLIFFYLFSAVFNGLFTKTGNWAAAPIFFTGIIYNFFIFTSALILGKQLKFLNAE